MREELGGIVHTATSPHGILPGEIALDDEFDATALAGTLQTGCPVIHIASHFVFCPGEERQSWLPLGNTGRLGVERLLSADFPWQGVELVALFACETAIGAGWMDHGGRFGGLTSLLFERGAGSVLASLWHTHDQSTSALMRRFYDGWCRRAWRSPRRYGRPSWPC